MSEEAENTLTEDLAAAWDAAEGGDDGVGEQQTADPVHESGGEPGTVSGFDSAGESDPAEHGDADAVGVQGSNQPPDGANSLAEEVEKPPVGLSPEAREHWAELPDVVKQDIAKREKDFENGITKYAQNAKRAEAMDRSLAPFQQLFAINGGPGNTLPGLLQTASVLQMGSPQQKAEQVASIIKQFGVDIRTLDNMLVGKGAPKDVQQQTQLDQMLNQKLAPLQQQLQTYQQREQMQQQEAQQHINSELQQFAAQNEFYNDVRNDMADLMDMAANRGRQMSLEEAYNTACQAHPQISKVLAGRTSQGDVNRKRNAASSIHGSQGGSMQGAEPGSIAEALNQAWDSAGRM